MRIPFRRRPDNAAPRSDSPAGEYRERPVRLRESGCEPYWHLLYLAEAECSRAERYGRPLALLVVEAWPASDDPEANRPTEDWLRERLRKADTPGYLGNGRYAVLLPETGANGAGRLSARLRKEVPRIRTGFSSFPQDGVTLGDLVVAARRDLRASEEDATPQRRAFS